MGNSNSADTPRLRSSNLKSPRKRFLKGKKFRLRGRVEEEFTDLGEPPVRMHSAASDAGGSGGGDKFQTETDPQFVVELDDDMLEQIVTTNEVETWLESGSLEVATAAAAAPEDDGGDGSAIAVVHTDETLVSEANNELEEKTRTLPHPLIGEEIKCAADQNTVVILSNIVGGVSNVRAESAIHTEEQGDRDSNAIVISRVEINDTSDVGGVAAASTSSEIQITVDADHSASCNECKENTTDEDVTEDLSNTEYTDPLITNVTTPYFSPDEEFENNIFDDPDIVAAAKLNFMEKQETRLPTEKIIEQVEHELSSAMKSKQNVTMEKDLLKPSPSSFTVVKHKKVELSPTTFPSSTAKAAAIENKGTVKKKNDNSREYINCSSFQRYLNPLVRILCYLKGTSSYNLYGLTVFRCCCRTSCNRLSPFLLIGFANVGK